MPTVKTKPARQTDDRLLTRSEAAAYLSVSTRHLDRQPIARIRLGRLVRYRKVDLDAYLMRCRQEPASGLSPMVRVHPRGKSAWNDGDWLRTKLAELKRRAG